MPVAALAAFALASVALAEGNAETARDGFRVAFRRCGWPSACRTRRPAAASSWASLARALGDVEGADLDLDAALVAYEELGAVLDAKRVRVTRGAPLAPAGGLSQREIEVLRLVATGARNREVATALTISEHTVARHLQNIYSKLGVSSRAAATAYAHANHLM